MLSVLQIIIAVIIIALILMQERTGGIGGIFGGGGGGEPGFYQARRGLSKFIFILTLALIAVLVGLALLNFIIS